MSDDNAAIAAALYNAYVDAEPIDPESIPPKLTIEDGYEIQRAVTERRTEGEGPVVGYKIGFTSQAVRSDLGVDSPSYGRVLSNTVRTDDRFSTEAHVDARIEPEIAFVLDRPLSPPLNRLDVVAATRFVVPAIEVVDSRVRGWEIDPVTAIADNSLGARLLVGTPVPIGEHDLSLEGAEVLISGDRRGTGLGSAVLGHPADAVVWLAEKLDEHDNMLDAGDIVTTGSLTEPIPIQSGETAVVRFSSLGTVTAYAE